MLVNRLSGLVLPASSKYLIDDVIGEKRGELLVPLALVAGAATLVQAVTSFALSQVLGVAAQRAITDMRRRVEEHVARLPVRYFDSTQAGQLISRIMSDAEGIRNLVGTGLVQLTVSIVTAIAALAYLFYLNWRLTLATLLALGRTVNLSRRPFEVVGVMTPGLQHVGGAERSLPHGETADFWIPLPLNPSAPNRMSRALSVVARLRGGVSVTQANGELVGTAKLHEQPRNAVPGLDQRPLRRSVSRSTAPFRDVRATEKRQTLREGRPYERQRTSGA